MMSWIEKHALAVLLRKESASIKDMRPIDVPANQFSYHLKSLIHQTYVYKVDRGEYALTPAGLQFAGTLSTAHTGSSENLKTVIVLYGRTADGKVSLFQWSRQPYLGMVTLPHDRVHYGDSIEQAVKNACLEKLGVAARTRYVASSFVKIFHNDQLVSHMHGLVYKFDAAEISYPHISRNGVLNLVNPNQQPNLMNGTKDFIQKLESGEHLSPLEIELNY